MKSSLSMALLATLTVLGGCHLIFPYGTAPADTGTDDMLDGQIMPEGVSSIDISVDGPVYDWYKVKPDKGKTDGQKPDAGPDAYKADGPLKPDGPKPDSLPPDSLPQDNMLPDAYNPCATKPCLNGGTCSIGDGGGYVCSCKTGYAGPTCNKCATNYCGYASGNCQLKPTITGLDIDCSMHMGCQTNESYEVAWIYTNANKFTADVTSHQSLITGKMGTFAAVKAGPYSNPPYANKSLTGSPQKIWYKLADKVFTTNPKPYAIITVTVEDTGVGKTDCKASANLKVDYN